MEGQECSGNLGENIFEEGDFGSGASNILQTNPQIAPGYIYTTSPPPNDGFYTITNNTTPWGSFASVWVDTRDNSSDPNGYMMVVNASFTPGLFYRQQVDGLCENSLYEFSCDVINLILPGRNEIKPNVSFLIDGNEIYETGNIPENAQWGTYRTTFTTAPGQTSIILALRNNAPGGNGNDIALDNISFRACGPGLSIVPNEPLRVCAEAGGTTLEAEIDGNQFTDPTVQWQQSLDDGMTWQDLAGETGFEFIHTGSVEGLYYYRFLLANGSVNILNPFCRVVSETKIVEVVPTIFPERDTICEGLTYELGSQLITTTGVYQDTLTSSLGCDSVVQLELTVVEDEGIALGFDIENPTCVGNEDGSILIQNISNGNTPYTLTVNGNDFEFPLVEMLAEGEYAFRVEDRFGCQADTIISLEDPAAFEVELGEDIVVELGQSIQVEPLFSEAAEGLVWSYNDSIICDTGCFSLEYIPRLGGVLSLSAKALASSCVEMDALRVKVEKVRKAFMPNIFTPNGDGTNDVFLVQGAVPNVESVVSFQVFNRWGGLVFERRNFLPNDIVQGWDGTLEGQFLPEGVYLYVVKIRFLDGAVLTESGDVTLLR